MCGVGETSDMMTWSLSVVCTYTLCSVGNSPTNTPPLLHHSVLDRTDIELNKIIPMSFINITKVNNLETTIEFVYVSLSDISLKTLRCYA